MASSNPAARLHQILLRAKTVESGVSRDLWARAFDLPSDQTDENMTEVISRLLQLRKLIEETHDSLKSIEGLHERYFRPFARLRAIPSVSLGGLNTTDIRGSLLSITEGDMTVLEFCSEKLESLHREPIIDESELQNILVEVGALFDDVKTSSLDPDLKTFILDGLESIRRGINEFRIRGPIRLKETIAEIIGNVAVNHEIIKAAEAEPHLQKLRAAFNHLAAVVAFASDSVTLLTAFTGPLLPGG